jgi:hypothetical protein
MKKPWAWLLAALGVAFAALIGAFINAHYGQVEEKITRPSALTVVPSYDDALYSDFAILVLPHGVPDEVKHATICEPMFKAARAAGAVHISPLRLRLLLGGNTLRGVTMTGMSAQIESRSKPLGGALTDCPSGGVIDVPNLVINLDQPNPIAVVRGTHRAYFATHAITLAKGEKDEVAMTVTTGRGYVRWWLLVQAAVGNGTPRTFRYGFDGDQPFQVTSKRCSAHAYSPYYELTVGQGVITHKYGSACSLFG